MRQSVCLQETRIEANRILAQCKSQEGKGVISEADFVRYYESAVKVFSKATYVLYNGADTLSSDSTLAMHSYTVYSLDPNANQSVDLKSRSKPNPNRTLTLGRHKASKS